MAAKFSVSILPRAEADFDSIYSWICERSPQGAKRWSDAFEAIVNRIADSPQEFASAVEAEEKIREGLPDFRLLLLPGFESWRMNALAGPGAR